MRHEITFQLVNPNLKKWHLYTSLMPIVDKICADHEMVIARRTIDVANWQMTEIVVVNDQKKLFTAKHKVVELLQRNNIETIVIAMTMINPLEIKTNDTFWRIQELYQTEKNMDKWVSVMPRIDSYARSYGVIINRLVDRKNFSCKITYDYIDDNVVEIISFYAGQILADSHVFLDNDIYTKTANDVKTSDLFMELDEITKEHRQLSLL